MKTAKLVGKGLRRRFRLILPEFRGIALKIAAVSMCLPGWVALFLSAPFPAWSADGLMHRPGVQGLMPQETANLSVPIWLDVLRGTRDAPATVNNSEGSYLRTAQFFRDVSDEEYRAAVFINAAREGEVEKVRQFLAEGMDVNVKNKSGNTALMEACAAGQQQVVGLLLDKGADVRAKNNIGETAIRKTIRNKQFSMLRLFGARKLLKWDVPSWIDLVLYGDPEIIRQEIRVMPRGKAEAFWRNVLWAACRSGSIKMVRLFLDNHADPNQQRGVPLSACCESAPLEAVRLLLDRGAKVNEWSKKPHVVVACAANRPDVLTLLLDRGADINARVERGDTALMVSCGGEASKDSLVKILLERGADVNYKNKFGVTAMMIAARDGRVAAASMLLDKGADINARSEKGTTALKWATARGAKEVVSLLKSRGAAE